MSLELRGLSVDIGHRHIVHDVHIAVPERRFVGLLGPNGSGKSTILKAIYRARRPAAGQIVLDGEDLLAMHPRESARRVAVVAQETTVEFDFTVYEMVMIGRTPHKRAFERDTDEDHMAVAAALERVGCDDLAARSFNTLSGGEKQRVLIARALAQGADHLILDEPTNHLDIRYQVEVLELVAGLKVTVLAALHDLSLAALFCDTVYLLTDGRVIASGEPEAVITTETVRSAYGADVLVVAHPETGTPHLIPRRTPPGALTNEEPLCHPIFVRALDFVRALAGYGPRRSPSPLSPRARCWPPAAVRIRARPRPRLPPLPATR
jgi:iron complex transport system ATP-binding protein